MDGAGHTTEMAIDAVSVETSGLNKSPATATTEGDPSGLTPSPAAGRVDSGPVPKRLRLDDPNTSVAAATVPAVAPVVQMETPLFDGKKLEVLWNVNIDGKEEWVWWGCRTQFIGKRDKKLRCVYSLTYDERLDLGFTGEEVRKAVFTAPDCRLLRDQEGRGHMMQFRFNGETTQPIPHPKTSVVVQSTTDQKEWLAGTIVAIEEDGRFTVQIGTKKEKNVDANRVEMTVPPPGLPKFMLVRLTTRFVDKAITAAINLPEMRQVQDMPRPAQAQKLAFDRIRACKPALTDVLLTMVGTHNTVDDYETAIDAIDHEDFCKTHITTLAQQAVADAAAEMKAMAVMNATPKEVPDTVVSDTPAASSSLQASSAPSIPTQADAIFSGPEVSPSVAES